MARPFDKPDIHAEIAHRLHHIEAVADAHLKRQIREVATVAGDDLRQNIVADGAAGVNADSAVVITKQPFDFARLLQQRHGARI